MSGGPATLQAIFGRLVRVQAEVGQVRAEMGHVHAGSEQTRAESGRVHVEQGRPRDGSARLGARVTRNHTDVMARIDSMWRVIHPLRTRVRDLRRGAS